MGYSTTDNTLPLRGCKRFAALHDRQSIATTDHADRRRGSYLGTKRGKAGEDELDAAWRPRATSFQPRAALDPLLWRSCAAHRRRFQLEGA